MLGLSYPIVLLQTQLPLRDLASFAEIEELVDGVHSSRTHESREEFCGAKSCSLIRTWLLRLEDGSSGI